MMNRIELDEWVRRARFLHDEMEDRLENLEADLDLNLDDADSYAASVCLTDLEALHTKMGNLLETMEQVSVQMVQHELAEKTLRRARRRSKGHASASGGFTPLPSAAFPETGNPEKSKSSNHAIYSPLCGDSYAD
jgi:hypothetical protein